MPVRTNYIPALDSKPTGDLRSAIVGRRRPIRSSWIGGWISRGIVIGRVIGTVIIEGAGAGAVLAVLMMIIVAHLFFF
jgi:hypothetical protein